MKMWRCFFCIIIGAHVSIGGMERADTSSKNLNVAQKELLFDEPLLSYDEQNAVISKILERKQKRYQKALARMFSEKLVAHAMPPVFEYVCSDDYAPLIVHMLTKKMINTKAYWYDENAGKMRSLFLEAVSNAALENAQLMLEHHADPNCCAVPFKNNPFGLVENPVLCAIRQTDIPMLSLLLDRKADPNFSNEQVRLPLLQLCHYYHHIEKQKLFTMAKLLLEGGANPHKLDSVGLEFDLRKNKTVIVLSAWHFAHFFKYEGFQNILRTYSKINPYHQKHY